MSRSNVLNQIGEASASANQKPQTLFTVLIGWNIDQQAISILWR